jgi:hypothetical protein
MIRPGSPNWIVPTAPWNDSSKRAASTEFVQRATRELITSAVATFYFSTLGSDSTGSGTISNPFATPSGAYSQVTSLYDFNGNAVYLQTLSVATFGDIVLSKSWTGGGALTFVGGTTGGTATINATANCIQGLVTLPGPVALNDFKLRSVGNGISMAAPSVMTFSRITFEACSNAHIICATAGAKVTAATNYTVSAGAGFHVWCSDFGTVELASRTVNISTASLAFAVFIYNPRFGNVLANAMTFTGATATVTGTNWYVNYNGIIYTNGAPQGFTYFPGNSIGTTNPGGTFI